MCDCVATVESFCIASGLAAWALTVIRHTLYISMYRLGTYCKRLRGFRIPSGSVAADTISDRGAAEVTIASAVTDHEEF